MCSCVCVFAGILSCTWLLQILMFNILKWLINVFCLFCLFVTVIFYNYKNKKLMIVTGGHGRINWRWGTSWDRTWRSNILWAMWRRNIWKCVSCIMALTEHDCCCQKYSCLGKRGTCITIVDVILLHITKTSFNRMNLWMIS